MATDPLTPIHLDEKNQLVVEVVARALAVFCADGRQPFPNKPNERVARHQARILRRPRLEVLGKASDSLGSVISSLRPWAKSQGRGMPDPFFWHLFGAT